MISKYCNVLNELEFCSKYVPEFTLYEMRTLFELLRTPRIQYITSRLFFDMISGCWNLEVLDMYFDRNAEALIPSNSTLPKLMQHSVEVLLLISIQTSELYINFLH